MNFKKLIIFFICIVIISCEKEENIIEIPPPSSDSAKVVGYFPWYRFALNNDIEYCRLTHLNIAFANPNSSGRISLPANSSNVNLQDVINRAKSENNNIKIYISIGGGGLGSEALQIWKNFLSRSDQRSLLIDNLTLFVTENNLDGVDVDLEWEAVTSGYSEFVIDLKSSLSSVQKGMSAALPAKTKYDNLSNQAIQAFDFINIMAYDFTGPWNPTNSGQHSSYLNAMESIDFWKNKVNVPSSKLTLGVPFYGYDFTNNSNVTAFTYNSMISTNSSYSELDNVGLKFYNGRPTIKSKVRLASQQVSGIMIWEVGQDAFNEYSLLRTIHNEYKSLGVKTTNLCLD